MRMNKGFSTIECYTGLGALTEKGGQLYEDASDSLKSQGKPCVLLECMSNLVANEMYEPGGAGNDAVASVLAGIEMLKNRCRHLVVVTNEICSESTEDTSEMALYKKMLAEINRGMAATGRWSGGSSVWDASLCKRTESGPQGTGGKCHAERKQKAKEYAFRIPKNGDWRSFSGKT